MEIRVHPSYQKRLQKNFIKIWLTGALSFGFGLYFHRSGHEALGWIILSLFAISIFGGLMYLTYLHYHVSCLACKNKTKTKVDTTKTKWIAVCSHCQIKWDLQTSVGGD